MRSFSLLAFALCALLVGCDTEAMFEKFVPQVEAKAGMSVIAQLSARDFAAIEARLEPSLREPGLRGKLEQVAQQIPSEPVKSAKTIGFKTTKGVSDETFQLSYEYEYPSAWMIANVVLQRKAGELYLSGVHLQRTEQSFQTLNAFTLKGKGLTHVLFLALCVAIPMFCLVALVICLRTPIPKKKWLWCLFVALGFVQFSLDWRSGEWAVQPFSFMLFGAGFFKGGPYGQLTLNFALPVGACVFMLRRKSLWPTGAVEAKGELSLEQNR